MSIRGRIRYEQLNEDSITSKLATKQELNQLKTTSVTGRNILSSDSSTVNIDIPNFDSTKDALTVYQNSVYIREHASDGEYTVSGNNIVKNNGSWPAGTILDFQVIRITG